MAIIDILSFNCRNILSCIFGCIAIADAIHSDIQVPQEVEKAGVPPEIRLVNMGAWGNSPYVIQAIRQRILECDPTLVLNAE